MVYTPPMKAKRVIVSVAVGILCLAVQVSGRPQDIPNVATNQKEEGQVTPLFEFDFEQTETSQTEPSPTDKVTEIDPNKTDGSETNIDQTDLISGAEDDPSGTEESEVSPNGTKVLGESPGEIDVTETNPNEDQMPEPDPSESKTPETIPSENDAAGTVLGETDDSLNTPSEASISKTEEGQKNVTESKPEMTETIQGVSEANHSETDVSEAKTGETDIPVLNPSETEARPDEIESGPNVTTTEKSKPSETVPISSSSPSPSTRPDQDKTSSFGDTSSVTDSTTTAKTTQATTRPTQTTRRPTVATKRPSQIGGSGGFPLPNARPGVMVGSKPDQISGAKVTKQNKTTCRKPGVEYPIGITFDELRAALEEARVLLIDIRQPWELRETGRLPWSYNLPLPEIEEAVKLSENAFMERYGFPKPMPEDDNVVLTCRSGRRVQQAWDLLEPYGYCNMRLYFGSYLDWKSRGGPLLPVPPVRRP